MAGRSADIPGSVGEAAVATLRNTESHNSWVEPKLQKTGAGPPPALMSNNEPVLNKAERYSLPKEAYVFLTCISVCNLLVFIERCIILLAALADDDGDQFYGMSAFALALTFSLCVGNQYMAWVYVTRVNVYMMINFFLSFTLLVGYHSLYALNHEARCSERDRIEDVCLLTFYLLVAFYVVIAVIFAKLRESMAWLFFKRAGANPKLRKLYNAYLLIRSSFSLNILCAVLVLVSTWKLVVLQHTVMKEGLALGIVAMVGVTVVISMAEIYGKIWLRSGIEGEDHGWIRRYKFCSCVLPLFTIGVLCWGNIVHVELFKSGKLVYNSTDESTKKIETHSDAEFLFALVSTSLLCCIVLVMRVLVWWKLAYLTNNFGSGLPEKVLQDKFFFSFERTCPLVAKHLCCNEQSTRTDEKTRGNMKKLRTMSGTSLGEVRVDTKASPRLAAMEANSKPKDEYVLM
jgi:hypothetical protein|eukprot:g4576.t1